MKRILSLIVGVLYLITVNAQVSQTEKDLMKKYWDYRDKYKKHFVKIGTKNGESLPISLWYKKQNCGDFQGGLIKMGDAMGMHGDYMCLLATEYYLTKKQGGDNAYSISLSNSDKVISKFSANIFKYPMEMLMLPFSILFIFCRSLSHRLASSVCVMPIASLRSFMFFPNLSRNSFSGVTDIPANNILTEN